MGPLSEHGQNVLLDLEMSLLTDTRDPVDLIVRCTYARAQRRALWVGAVLVLGVIVMTVFLTEALVVSVAGLLIAIGSSLVCAHRCLTAWRASRMLDDR